MKNLPTYEEYLNESKSPEKIISFLENELDWNQGSASIETDPKQIKFMFDKGPKNDKNIFITYIGMKGSSIAKDIRAAIKSFGMKAVQVKKENGDNEHYYYIEIEK